MLEGAVALAAGRPRQLPAALLKIANAKIQSVHVDNVSGPSLSIGTDCFHVGGRAGEVEEVIFKNPAPEIARGPPGHYDNRRLTALKRSTPRYGPRFGGSSSATA
jgi:hypothetical protein